MREDNDRNLILVVVLFMVTMLTIIAVHGIELAKEILAPTQIQTPVTKSLVKPSSLPNFRSLYFVECVNEDVAIVATKENIYYFKCEKGKWTEIGSKI